MIEAITTTSQWKILNRDRIKRHVHLKKKELHQNDFNYNNIHRGAIKDDLNSSCVTVNLFLVKFR